ncbi:hypothetical protein BS47DRAFT_1397765 [Hydnum rufescens UP504]|uniref:Uncharacterized protein n=1 Tax=Hydnum rufescens UP504 TaxID=1448309 RepID=A0A9P6AMC3_9AGAM|nr:hypothetical protein BS47DRAFT_1397765 [Hydnum rufescens UP504]
MGTDTPTEYEIFNGGDPCSTEWCALRIQHLRILVQHLPDVSTIASQGDYLGSYIPQSYEEWQQVFGIDNFGDFLIDDLKFGLVFKDFTKQAFGDRYEAEAALAMFSTGNFESVRQVACSVSIANAQQMDGSVFWASGSAVAMIPEMFQSAFTHCPTDHESGLIDKWLVDVLNMAKQMYKRHDTAIPLLSALSSASTVHPTSPTSAVHSTFVGHSTPAIHLVSTLPSKSTIHSTSAICSMSAICLMPAIPLTSACPSTLTIPLTSARPLTLTIPLMSTIPSMYMIPSASMVPSASTVPSVSTVPSASAISLASTISSASTVPSTSGVPSTSANAPFKSRTTTGANFITRFAQAALDQDVDWSQDVDSGLEFVTPSDSEDSNNEHFDDVFSKEDENGNAQEGIRDDQLHDNNNSTADILPNVSTLKDGPLSLDQWKMCELIWGQFMKAVDFLVQKWQVKPSRILAQAGHLALVPPSRTENLWNAFLSSEKDNRPTDEPLKAWNAQMKVKYATLFEGLNKNEAAAKKDSLLKGLQEKREPHGIGILNSRDGAKWAFPMKQLGLKLCTKELTLVGWPDDLRVPTPNQSEYSKDELVPFINNCAFSSTCHLHVRKWNSVAKDPDDVDQYPLIENNKGETLLRICDIQPWLPKKSGTLIHPQCCIRRGNSKHDNPGPTPVRTSRTILHPVGALVHALTLTPALIPALAPGIVLILNLLFNLSLNLKVIQGNSHDHDQEVPWRHTMSNL